MDKTVKIKLGHEKARLPAYMSPGAACFDLFAASEPEYDKYGNALIDTGLIFELPHGYGVRIYSRSGQGFRHNVSLVNSVGVIDSDYRGRVMVKLKADTVAGQQYLDSIQPGDSVAQAEIFKIEQYNFEGCRMISPTERGDKGFGSTG